MSTGEWTHSICFDCWRKQYPDTSLNAVLGQHREICCFCAASTYAGIYVRRDPLSPELLCRPKDATEKVQ